MKKKQRFLKGWNEAKVRKVITHYEAQTEEEEYAEIEAARKAETFTMMEIPTKLVPKVRALLAGKRSA
jgi:hypothetical protein